MFSNKSSHTVKKLIVHVSRYELLLQTSIKGLKIFLHKIYYLIDLNFWLLENLFDLCLQKMFLAVEKSLFVRNDIDCGKLP